MTQWFVYHPLCLDGPAVCAKLQSNSHCMKHCTQNEFGPITTFTGSISPFGGGGGGGGGGGHCISSMKQN